MVISLISNYSNTKVTLELREVLNMTDENGLPFNLWDFEYPSYYTDAEKTAFEQRVIDHYLFHQIGCETVGRFKHNFRTRVREIMPLFIQYYESAEVMSALADPFGNVDIVETYTEQSTLTATGESTATSEGQTIGTKTDYKSASDDFTHKFSNTPQGAISNLDSYLTEASVDDRDIIENINTNETDNTTAEATANTSATNVGDVTHTLTRKGNQGVNTYAHDMRELRETFINVDMMVIGALRDLFLLIY